MEEDKIIRVCNISSIIPLGKTRISQLLKEGELTSIHLGVRARGVRLSQINEWIERQASKNGGDNE